MAKSSIHVRPVGAGSEQHNQREKELNYVRADLTSENSFYKLQSIADAKREVKENYQKHTRQKLQAKATPIREGVLLISKDHTAEDLKRVAQKLEQRFGIRTIQAYCHKDEGHYDKITKEWQPNYHAHMVFNWTEKNTGKSIKMNREDMAEMQTIVANELGLERGEKSTKRHIESTRYKAMKEENDLKTVHNLKNGLVEAKEVIQESEHIKTTIESLREAKKSLKDETDLIRFNKTYLEKQSEETRQELRQLKEQAQELRQNRGFKL